MTDDRRSRVISTLLTYLLTSEISDHIQYSMNI